MTTNQNPHFPLLVGGAVTLLGIGVAVWMSDVREAALSAPRHVERRIAASTTLANAGSSDMYGRGRPAEVQDSYLASPEALKAMALPAGAVFRNTALYETSNGVICGEVSRSAADTNFRRFVYIATARTGFVDDGSALFREINVASCMPGGEPTALPSPQR